MSAAMQPAPAATGAAPDKAGEVMPAGYVEATTPTAMLGWAWVPGHPEALTVELRLGPVVVAEAKADELRDDLARSGIGEGRHAFTLTVPEAYRGRLSDLLVFARSLDGKAVPLGAPPAEDALVAKVAQIQRGLEMLVGSQRVLHRNLQAALLAQAEKRPSIAPGDQPDAAAHAGVADSIAALEHFVTRLEKALAGVAISAPAQPRQYLAPMMLAAGAMLAGSVWALLRAMPG
jgi:hypothetical protein